MGKKQVRRRRKLDTSNVSRSRSHNDEDEILVTDARRVLHDLQTKKSTNIKHQAMTEALDAARSAYSKWYTIQSRVAVLANAFLSLIHI